MIPRLTPIIAAWARSLAPNLERMFLTWPFTESSVTEDSVKGHVRNILSKLGANDRTHAAMIGVKRGIIEL